MSTKERRAEIMRILRSKKQTTVPYLANSLDASERTIQRDLVVLSVEEHFPILTVQGNGGGVMLTDWHHPHKNIFTCEQNATLNELLETAAPKQREILVEMLNAYGKALATKEG
ncbi:hypothetical protein FACS18949_12210 [Clostridia bacterium]|nr:hypothetical protein FACS18949_12210 [Clostridia bacterium]